jgi:tetratricopeptide (TPR) repeat protein
VAAEQRYAAFISYSHSDERWARWLHRAIEHYRVPKRLQDTKGGFGPIPARLRPVFRDREELPAAADLSEEIRAALRQSRFLIVVCSPATVASKWVSQEILEFKHSVGGDRVLCLIVDGEPGAGGSLECFPEPLRFQVDDRGEVTSLPAEPVAADVREGKDGKTLARMKILAGMLGVGLDQLRQREQQRKQRNLAAIASISLAGMLAMGWLAWAAILARGDAERRQEQAEDLVDFMLTDLHAELRSVGRLDAMNATAAKAMSYFASLDPRDLTDEALQGRAKALRQIGDIHRTQFEYDQAAAAFSEALRMDTELLARDPDNNERRFNLGQSEFWVGYVLYENGDYEAAIGYLSRYLDISRALYAAEPDNIDWLMELSYAHNNLAAVYRETGELEQALEHMTESVRLNRAGLDRRPDDAGLRIDLAASLAWMGTVQRGNGMLEESAANRSASRELYAELLRNDLDNAQLKDELAYAYRGEGLALSLVGRHEEALAAYRNALDGFDELILIDPDNLRWARDRMETISERLLAQSEAGMAEFTDVDELVAALEALGDGDQATAAAVNPQRQGRQALANAVVGFAQLPSAEDEGRRRIDNSLDSLHELRSRNPADPDINLWLLETALMDAAVGATQSKADFRAIVDSFFKVSGAVNDPLYLSAQARAWFVLEQPDRADAAVRTLRAAGYRSRKFDRECRYAGIC